MIALSNTVRCSHPLMLKEGSRAPSFTGTDQTGKRVDLAELLETGPVLLYFYPADFTPICTAQACAFRDRAEDLARHDVQIVGVSPQSEGSHQRWCRPRRSTGS